MAATLLSPPAVPVFSPPTLPAPVAEMPAVAQPWATSPERSNVRAFVRRTGWIALVCAVVPLLFDAASRHSLPDYFIYFSYTFSYTFGLWLANGYTADTLNHLVGWSEQPVRRLLLTLVVSLVASLLVIVLVSEGFSILLWHRIPGYTLNHRFLLQQAFPLLLTVVVSLFMHSRSFLLAWREATVRAERLEKESAVARLDSLRRQVDPHFLFNSLNALTSLVEDEPARAVRFIRQLSQVYRYVLDSQSQELVPLTEELAFAESYIFLQKTRLDEALQVEFALPAATLGTAAQALYLPPLALQLLLENALKHNTAYQADPLRLHVAVDVAARTLTVRNTLRPRRLSADEASGRGLANLRARYGFLTKLPVAAGPVGKEFVVVLPLLELKVKS